MDQATGVASILWVHKLPINFISSQEQITCSVLWHGQIYPLDNHMATVWKIVLSGTWLKVESLQRKQVK